jgi:class 3 adenylate cyclase
MQRVKTGLISLLVAALHVFTGACQAETVVVDRESPIGFWFVDDEKFLDQTASLTAAEIAKLQDRFKGPEDFEADLGQAGKYWSRFSVENKRERSVEFLIRSFSSRPCAVHLVDKDGQVFSTITASFSGYNLRTLTDPSEDGSSALRSRYGTFHVPANSTVSVLTECALPTGKYGSLSIFEAAPYLEASRGPLYLEGTVLGATVFMALVALFSAILNRDRTMFLYAMWLVISTIVTLDAPTDGSRMDEFLVEHRLGDIWDSSNAQYLAHLSSLVFLAFCYSSLDLNANLDNGRPGQKLTRRLIKIAFGLFLTLLVVPAMVAVLRLMLAGLGDPIPLLSSSVQGLTLMLERGRGTPIFANVAGLLDIGLRLVMLVVASWVLLKGQRSSRYVVAALLTYFIAYPGLWVLRDFIPTIGSLEFGFFHFPLLVGFMYCAIGLTMAFAVTVRNKEIKEALDEQVATRQAFMEEQNQVLEQRVKERTHELMLQTEKTERLMLNILPAQIAERLKKGEPGISDSHASVSILFSDLVGFTALSSKRSADEVVKLLNDLFSRFDIRAKSLGLEKIKTIGDAYMVAGGIPQADERHAALVTEMALGMREDLQAFNNQNGTDIAMRIGINSGSVIAGVIGHTKFSYDLWGNTVNAASRMESTCEVGQIQVSASTYELIKDLFSTRERGFVECKGLGQVRTHFVIARAGE